MKDRLTIDRYKILVKMLKSSNEEDVNLGLGIINKLDYKTNQVAIFLLLKNVHELGALLETSCKKLYKKITEDLKTITEEKDEHVLSYKIFNKNLSVPYTDILKLVKKSDEHDKLLYIEDFTMFIKDMINCRKQLPKIKSIKIEFNDLK